MLKEDPQQPGRRRDADHHRPGARRRRGDHQRRTSTSPRSSARQILEIGYDSSHKGFDGASCGVSVSIGAQSPDIAQGVDDAVRGARRARATDDELDRQGAGDQGLMFGYACTRHPRADAAADRAGAPAGPAAVRRSARTAPSRTCGPDGKTQVTIEYDGDTAGPPRHRRRLHPARRRHRPRRRCWRRTSASTSSSPVLDRPRASTPTGYRLLVNPTGRFEIGGPMGDAGLTGRKIIVDTYGGMARHGGGAFSGKDPSKVDRSAAYAMRWVAKNVVAAGLAERCEVQVAYAIGKAAAGRPVRRDASAPRRSPVDEDPEGRRSRSSTCARPRSSATSTCCARSTPRPPPTATSAASCRTSPGSAPTAPTR